MGLTELLDDSDNVSNRTTEWQSDNVANRTTEWQSGNVSNRTTKWQSENEPNRTNNFTRTIIVNANPFNKQTKRYATKAALGVMAFAVLELVGNAKAENGWVCILSDWLTRNWQEAGEWLHDLVRWN